MSSGAFDPTIRPVVHLWGIQTDNARVPDKNEIDRDIKLVNYKDIILDGNNYSVMLRNKNQALDLGAIAKGFAADEVKSIFSKNAIKSAIIDLGGNIFAMGSKPDDTSWKIGIQDPLKRRGEFVGTISVIDKSVVTSGNYERYFINQGKRFHHIINPMSGNPSDNGVISATIISDYSIDGDALSTCAFVMGLEKGLLLTESIKGVDAIFITEDRRIYTTKGINNKLELTAQNKYLTTTA
jgi:thiamine biosynthesis lipoprotein